MQSPARLLCYTDSSCKRFRRSRSEDGYWLIDEVALIDRIDDSAVAMKRYYELHREQPYREYGFFHTSRETLKLREKWAGVIICYHGESWIY